MSKQTESGGVLGNALVSMMHTIDMKSFSSKEKILFYKELVYMIHGGVSLVQAVDTIKKSTNNYALKVITTRISRYLNKGKSLSYALSRLPEYFDEGDSAIIKTGEATGNLDVVLQEIANEYTYLNQIKNKYKSALTYPCILIVLSIAAVLFLFSSVLPGILDMFEGSISELPLLTRILKYISDFFVNYWMTILITITTFFAALGIYISTESWKRRFSRMLMSLPLIGDMTKNYYLIKWARYTKLMLHSGLDYLQTFRLLRGILDVPAYQDMLERVMAGLQMGKSIYDSIKLENNIIYENVSVMIKVGEETAHLESSMQNIIDLYQEELDHSISQFSKVIEPIILIVMGGIVAVVASGVFGIVFSIMDSVSL